MIATNQPSKKMVKLICSNNKNGELITHMIAQETWLL